MSRLASRPVSVLSRCLACAALVATAAFTVQPVAAGTDPFCAAPCRCDVEVDTPFLISPPPCWVPPGAFISIHFDATDKGCCDNPSMLCSAADCSWQADITMFNPNPCTIMQILDGSGIPIAQTSSTRTTAYDETFQGPCGTGQLYMFSADNTVFQMKTIGCANCP